jgi:hypothetical protein
MIEAGVCQLGKQTRFVPGCSFRYTHAPARFTCRTGFEPVGIDLMPTALPLSYRQLLFVSNTSAVTLVLDSVKLVGGEGIQPSYFAHQAKIIALDQPPLVAEVGIEPTTPGV